MKVVKLLSPDTHFEKNEEINRDVKTNNVAIGSNGNTNNYQSFLK